ncbi:MAG: aldo/keto reductase [Synechococcaceae cyanobacterium]|nr:aldo/keto reductase [Synechococcaceae cyanobacterium]
MALIPAFAPPAAAMPGADPGIGVGTWAWGNRFLWGYDPAQDEELQACFYRAVALGLRFFDTADSYGTGRLQGRSEELLGRFCAALPEGERDRLCVATKLAPFPWRLGRRGYARAFAGARHRLQGKLDLVQLHWSTARYAPWQEDPLLDGLADLVQSGAVGALGVSNMGPRRLRRLHQRLAERGVVLHSLQIQLSLLAPDALFEGGVVEACRELGIRLIAYSPLALGLLGRQPGPQPPATAGPRGVLFRRLWQPLQPLLEGLQTIAAARGSEPAAVALNWCRAHGAMPIPGLRRLPQAEAAAAALAWRLEANERQELDRLVRTCSEAGARMPANPFLSD